MSAATGMDASRLMFAQTQDFFEKDAAQGDEDSHVNEYSVAKKCYSRFIREFSTNNEFVYRDTLRNNYAPLDGEEERKFYLNVNLCDLRQFLNTQHHIYTTALTQLNNANEIDGMSTESLQDKVDKHELFHQGSKVAEWLHDRPNIFLPAMEDAAREVADELTHPRVDHEAIHDIQIMLSSNSQPQTVRALRSNQVSHLVRVKGIIIAASQVRVKATQITLMCRSCQHTRTEVSLRPGFDGYQLPRKCANDQSGVPGQRCPLDPYFILPDKCKCVDFQVLKLQECPEDVPHGELPRHMQLYADRYLTDNVTPGNRINLLGIYCIKTMSSQKGGGDKNKAAIGIRLPYIRVVGIEKESAGMGKTENMLWTPEEEQMREKLANDPKAYETIVKSIAPSIYGSEDIKKAIACLLFSGSRKRMPDGLTRRGDINVLLLGDPGTAKSQLLKFVEKVAPIAVYTSGKGSSAAGLTASVIKDPATRGFMMEGGAMVLADGGVVCIDEFDKMREDDRVAIHEAMEQQTISIAKAGIVTTLNSRCAVLAAANSVFGRWDDERGDENIEFMPTILSRFDTIFVVKDEHDQHKDMILARHVMNIHVNAADIEDTQEGTLPLEFLRKYIAYAKKHCGPRLRERAAEKLVNHYVKLRNPKQADTTKKMKSAIPITVRQLEAIVRLSEALAKMRLAKFADVEEVDEAMRIFQVSTLEAAATGHLAGAEGFTTEQDQHYMNRIEAQLLNRFPIGTQVAERLVMQDFVRQSFPETLIRQVIKGLVRRGEVKYRFQKNILYRNR